MKPSEGFGAYFQEQIDDLKKSKMDKNKESIFPTIIFLIAILAAIYNCENTYSFRKEQITQQKETNIQLQRINQKLHMLTVDKSVDNLRVVGP